MPKVKAGAKKKPAAKRSGASKKPAGKARAKNARGSRKSAERPSFFETFFAPVERYTLAASAGAVVILLAGAFALWAGGYFGRLAQSAVQASETAALSAGFDIRRITLRGAHNIAHDDLLQTLGLSVGDSLLHADINDAQERVQSLGWVRSASVTRLMPNQIHVSVRERTPAAVWQVNFVLHLIDENGAVIRKVGADEYPQLPLIVGVGAPEAAATVLKALAAKPVLEKMTHALVRVGDRRWDMRLRNGVEVKLPEADFVDAIEALHVLHAAHQTLDQPIEYIDLRDPERVIMR